MTKAVILAGGLGTRISEETGDKPKPMVEIGGFPVLWHILKCYAAHGVRDFVICCGYRGYVIKEYFRNYALHMSDVTFDMRSGEMKAHQNRAEDWRVTLVDTGDATMTGGRLLRVREHLSGEDYFHFTYGDGLSDVDIGALEKYHKSHGRLATVTAVLPPGRFGSLEADGKTGKVQRFVEKPPGDGGLINGGFFVLSPRVIDDYINDGDATVWEQSPLAALAKDGELMAFRHTGFWQPMDTVRDRNRLRQYWQENNAPWKQW